MTEPSSPSSEGMTVPDKPCEPSFVVGYALFGIMASFCALISIASSFDQKVPGADEAKNASFIVLWVCIGVITALIAVRAAVKYNAKRFDRLEQMFAARSPKGMATHVGGGE